MEERSEQGVKHGDEQEQHRRLDVILQSEYAEEVRAILHRHYQRVRGQRPSAPPAEPDSSR